MQGNIASIEIEVEKEGLKEETKKDEQTEEDKNNEEKEETEIDIEELEEYFNKLLKELGLDGLEINSVCQEGSTIDNQKACLEEEYYKKLIEEKSSGINNVIEKLFSEKGEGVMKSLSIKLSEKINTENGLKKALYSYVISRINKKILEKEIELVQELSIFYGDLGLDISGLKSTGEGLGALTAYWVGYINNDPYLIAQVDLQKDLASIGSELNPLKKFDIIMRNNYNYICLLVLFL